MNWTRTLLDAFVMAILFNLAAVVMMLLGPRYMMGSYPRAIKAAAPMPQTSHERLVSLLFMGIGMVVLTCYGAASAVSAGVIGFANLFWTGYVEWLLVSLSDFIVLDMILLQTMKKHVIVPGTEGHPGYAFKSWMLHLALPEHFLLWPLVCAPLYALVQAGLGLLFS